MHYAFDYMWNFFDFGENGQVSDVKLKLRKFRCSFGRNHVLGKLNLLKMSIIFQHIHEKTKKLLI